ncbi:MAG: molybdopterin adenylyltransferase [Termitinemataceae bacterium]|nr:MAG: molybdopterin adenylyltransferase [Termitinemataceae bacterium]
MYSVLLLTISDKASRGERVDTAGPAVRQMLEAAGFNVTGIVVLPDEAEIIANALIDAADNKTLPLVLTIGGTGFSPRDVTPEATISVCERLAPGIPELMRHESCAITSRAALSRAAAGIRKRTLIINLPGSEKAATENLNAVLETLTHALDMLLERRSECAGAAL